LQFINAVTGSELQVGHGLESCTSEVHLSNSITLRGQEFLLVDTPGFNDTTRTDADILMEISVFLGRS
jgi:predicted GTPase